MFLKNFSKKKKINKWNFNGPENINSSCRFFLNQITSQNGWRQGILEEFFNMSAWCVCAKIWNISTLLRGIGICLHCFSPLMLLYFNFCDVVGNLIEGLYSVNVFVEVSVWPFERHCNFIVYIYGALIWHVRQMVIWFVHVVAKNLWSMPHLKLRGWVELYVCLDFVTSCELL